MSDNTLDDLAGAVVPHLPPPAECIRLRNRFGITQVQLAAYLNVSRKAIWTWESGKAEPSGDNRVRYAEVITLWQQRERKAGKDN
jgi:DNA-binding transcriptional regulator YiaG